jgi:membrane protein
MSELSRRHLLRILRGAVYEWNEDKAPRMAAAIAFYTVFSLTPIVVIAFKVAELTFGAEVALQQILEQAALLIGQEGAAGIELLIKNAPLTRGGLGSTMAGVGVMAFAATGVFIELKDALNTIWEVQPKPGLSLMVVLQDRLFGLAMVLIIWFLMLVSLMMSAALSGLSRFAGLDIGFLQFVESLVSLALTAVLFALIYRVLPDVHVAWRDIWLAAAVAAVLFGIGKQLFGLYLGHSTIGTSYGAAGSLIIVILWTYCTCLIVLFGAEMTQVHAGMRHAPVVPTEKAVALSEHDRLQQGIPRLEDIERAASDRPKQAEHPGSGKPLPGRRAGSALRSAAVVLSAAMLVAIWWLKVRRRG